MSYSPYLPAEEEDYDSEDGFIGNEGFDEDYLSQVQPTTQQSQAAFPPPLGTGQNTKNGFESRHSARSETRAARVWKPSRLVSSWPAYGGQLSLEDFQKAAGKGSVELVQNCLEEGIAVDEPLQSGWTALMYAANHGEAKMVKYLLSKGANPKYHSDMFTPLMAACNASSENNENIAQCVKILIESEADVNGKDRYHTTPLMMACREGHLAAVKELLRAGAEVNKQDSRGWTALTMATQRQRKDIVIELLDSGANPDIQHLDKLTVKDLAAHLPSDDMLALLERRPPIVSGDAWNVNAMPTSSENSYCTLEGGDVTSKLTDLRYGELEVFLLGLDLASLVPLFQQQLIDLNLLMTLTEQDLINAGVSQVGARKKILDALQALHKKDWEPSSLVSIHFNKQVMCADAVAMVANSSKHLRYIGSTIVYVKEHLRRHPNSILQPTDKVSPTQLLRHTDDALKNAQSLCSQLQTLKKALSQQMKGHNCKPPDAIKLDSEDHSKIFNKKSTVVLLLLALSLPVIVLYRQGRL